jgi:flagellar biosynthesis protein FlhA
VLFALAPGMPSVPFLLMSVALWSVARRIPTAAARAEQTATEPAAAPASPMEEHLTQFLETDRACLEIGSRLLGMVDPPRGLTLLQRIGTLRRDLAKRSGLWIPLVRIRDNSTLEPQEYRILIGGQEVARGSLEPDRVLAISADGTALPLPGLDTKDPAFGLPAKWISENERAQAELLGSTVVDAPSVLITHLREVLKRHAGELLSREDLAKLVDQVKVNSAAVVDEVIPNLLSMGTVHRVLTALLEERVPITNLTRIFEALAHHAPTTKDPLELAERVRGYLARAICEPFLDSQNRIQALVFEPGLELELRRSLNDKEKKLAIPPEALEAMIVRLATALRDTSQKQLDVALLVDSQLRRPLRQLLSRGLPDLTVIAYTEVPNDVLLEAAAIIKREEIFVRPAETTAANSPL